MNIQDYATMLELKRGSRRRDIRAALKAAPKREKVAA